MKLEAELEAARKLHQHLLVKRNIEVRNRVHRQHQLRVQTAKLSSELASPAACNSCIAVTCMPCLTEGS